MAPDRAELAELNRQFADIVASGAMRMSKPLPPERADDDHLDFARLVFRFDKIHYGRLRQLIDVLNRAPGRGGLTEQPDGSGRRAGGGGRWLRSPLWSRAQQPPVLLGGRATEGPRLDVVGLADTER